MDNDKPKFLEKLGYYTQKAFYYIEAINSISGFLIDARDQLSKVDEKQRPIINNGSPASNEGHTNPVEAGGVLAEDE